MDAAIHPPVPVEDHESFPKQRTPLSILYLLPYLLDHRFYSSSHPSLPIKGTKATASRLSVWNRSRSTRV